MSLRLVVAHGSRITGELLREALAAVPARGVEGVVSYGCRLEGVERALNAHAGKYSKFGELEKLRHEGITVPQTWRREDWGRVPLPVLARRFHHKGGTDIRFIRTRNGARVWAEKRDFFSQYIPNDQEYRVFVFRNAHLGTYEKVLMHPEMRRRVVGRNHHNGFGFQLVAEDAIPRKAVEVAKKAVKVLDLDFGAVDIIKGNDGKFYVLEVNTAPGVEGPGRQAFASLVKHIINWHNKGFPGRRDE